MRRLRARRAFVVASATVGFALSSSVVSSAEPVGPAPPPSSFPEATAARIVQGSLTSDFPAVGALLIGDLNRGVGDGRLASVGCTGTLIGCNTVLTAAHCVCGVDYSTGGCSTPPEARLFGIFFPHAGFYNATSITVDPAYDFLASIGDIAIVHLAGPVTGIRPATLTDRSPLPGETVTIVGYGRTADDLSDYGVKRVGTVTLSDCNDGTNGEVLCWSFDGGQSNTCTGDSGGPLFVNGTAGEMLAGVTSSGTGCLPRSPTLPARAWESGVFTERDWILQEVGTDLGGAQCGGEPAVGEPEVEVFTAEWLWFMNHWG